MYDFDELKTNEESIKKNNSKEVRSIINTYMSMEKEVTQIKNKKKGRNLRVLNTLTNAIQSKEIESKEIEKDYNLALK